MDLDAPVEYQDLETADAGYHSVSALAVVALVIGLLSPLAFVHPLLWTLPIAGCALAGVAMLRIDRSQGALIGRKAAIIGLALSIFCALGAVTQAATRRLWLAHRAERMADRLIELLSEGKSYEAHQLWARPQFRFPPGSDYQALYTDHPGATKDHEEFLNREVIRDLLTLGEHADVEHQKTELTYSGPEGDYLMVYYHLAGPGENGPIAKDIKFVVEHLVGDATGERWRVFADEVVHE